MPGQVRGARPPRRWRPGPNVRGAVITHIAQAEVQADGGGLVDDQQAVPVGVVEHLLGVRVVRGAEGVRADPPQQREVADHPGVVVALAAQRGIFVHPEATQGDGLPVEQQPRAVHGDRPDADRQLVFVRRPCATSSRYRYGPPGDHGRAAGTVRTPRAARAPGPRPAPSASRSRTDVAPVAHHLDLVVHLAGAGAGVEGGADRDVSDVAARRRVQPHRPVQPGVVEEVVKIALPRLAVGAAGCDPGRDRLPWSARCPPAPSPAVGSPQRTVRRSRRPRTACSRRRARRPGPRRPTRCRVGGRVAAQHDAMARPGSRAPRPPAGTRRRRRARARPASVTRSL